MVSKNLNILNGGRFFSKDTYMLLSFFFFVGFIVSLVFFVIELKKIQIDDKDKDNDNDNDNDNDKDNAKGITVEITVTLVVWIVCLGLTFVFGYCAYFTEETPQLPKIEK